MAVTKVASTTTSGNGVQNGGITRPAGIGIGDLLVLQVAENGAATFTVPAGYVLIGTPATRGNLSVACYWKVTTAAESGQLTLNFSATTQFVVCMTRFIGSVFSENSFPNYATVTATSANSITAANPGALVSGQILSAFMGSTSTTYSTPTVSGTGWGIDAVNGFNGLSGGDAFNTGNFTGVAPTFNVGAFAQAAAVSFRVIEAAASVLGAPLMLCEA